MSDPVRFFLLLCAVLSTIFLAFTSHFVEKIYNLLRERDGQQATTKGEGR